MICAFPFGFEGPMPILVSREDEVTLVSGRLITCAMEIGEHSKCILAEYLYYNRNDFVLK